MISKPSEWVQTAMLCASIAEKASPQQQKKLIEEASDLALYFLGKARKAAEEERKDE